MILGVIHEAETTQVIIGFTRETIMSSAAAIIVPALKKHTSTVIVAHGLGDR